MIRNLFQLFFLLISFQFFGQVYPVQITPIFNTPYSSRVSDYATSMDVKMQLLINPSDISITNRQVRLKMYLQGNNINAQSVDYVNGINPIYINGGELLTLTNLDIAALFRLENLQGISPAQYSNALPEGMYNVCFELYDFATNQRISQKSCAYLYLMLNDPPLLNTPAKNESIAVSDFPNILFTWTPRQLNATNVSYEFEIKEILDPTIDPQIGFLTSPTLYDETLYSTALLYDSSKPNLLAGKRYAWRVRAMSTSGLSLNNVFKNDGYSEIHHFTYASNCPAPTFILSEALSARSVRISWQGDNSHTKYHLQYKKANVSRAEWFEVYTMNTQTTLTDLEAGVTYEFRVGGSCEPAVLGNRASFTYSGINNFTLPAVGTTSSSFTCGLNPAVAIANQTPITNLIVTETFTAGDFPVKILELTGHNPYTGKGYIIVPYLADTKIAVLFNNITVNTNYQLINGIVETSYNPQAPNINDLEDLTGGNNGVIITQTISFVITTVTTNPNGDIIVSGANGEQIAIPGGSNTVITGTTATGGTGSIYNVDSQGNVTGPFMPAPGGATTPQNTDGVATNGQTTQFAAQGLTIAFEPTTATKYSWDIVPDTAPTYIKDKYAKVGSAYLPYKAVVNGQSDVLKTKITLTDTSIVLDSIIFKTQHGVLLDKVKNDNNYVLTLKGTQTYGEEEVQAVIKQGGKYKVAGAFRLVHVSEKPLNITLVPLNNTTSIPNNAISNLQTNYEKAGVKLTIKTAPVLMYDGETDAKITTSDSGVFDYYTDEEKTINAKIKALPEYDNKTYYLIYSNLPSDKDIEGFMALGGQFGYVFPNASSKTASHELAHGVFALQHPFTNAADKGKTPFLMDYGSGTQLWHNDWAQINNPSLKFYGFQGDSQGEFLGYRLTPDWKPFSFSGSSTYISGNIQEPNGAVYGISYNNEDYLAVLENGKYIYKSGQKVLTGFTSVDNLKDDADVILFWNRGVCGYSETYTSKWSYLKDKIGFNIDDVTDSGKIVFKERVPCKVNGVNQGSTVADKECDNKDISVLNSQKNALVALIDNSDLEKITTKINEVDVCTIRKLTYEQLIEFFKKLTTSKDIGDGKEKAIVKLVASIKSEKINDFFTLVQADNNKILKNLMFKIDDKTFFYGANNYTNLVKLFLQMFNEVNKDVLKGINANELKTFTVVQNSYLTPSNNESIFSINFQEDKPEMKVTQGVWQVTKDCDWVAQSGGDGYENCTTTQIVKYEEPVLIKPFDMVVIADNSDFNLISGITDNTKKVTVIPALLLYYAHEKGQVENLKTYVQNTLDVVTLLVPVTKIATGPKWLAKTFTFVDKWSKVNAGVNLGVNNTPLNQIPEIKNALDAYNAITAVMNITSLAGAIGQNKIATFFKELDNATAKKVLISQAKNGSDDAKKILDVEAELKAYSEAKLGKDWWKLQGAGKFMLSQIDDYVALATNVGKGVNKDKILLGEFIDGSPNSYVTRAKNEGYTYFDMGDKWDEAFNLVNKSKDEMWKINKKFIDEQKALNKEFYFSQEPWNFPSTPKTFRFREAEYLIDMGAKDFQKINDNTWKVIW
ncbi:fibronectin type III domain-containing protein [Flavobacterium psychrophilum]